MQRQSVLFAIKFFIIFFAAQAIIYLAPLEPLTHSIASLEANLLDLEFAKDSIVAGNSLYVITNSCTGLVSWSILAAIIFSLHKPTLGKKIQMAVFGGILLFLVNLARVYGVLLVGVQFGGEAAGMSHVISWFAMSGLILAVWFALTKRMTGIKEFSELL